MTPIGNPDGHFRVQTSQRERRENQRRLVEAADLASVSSPANELGAALVEKGLFKGGA